MALLINRLSRAIAGAKFKKKQKPAIVKVDGVPESLPPEALKEVVAKHLNCDLHSTQFIHLSGWKSTGAFRIFIHTKDNKTATIIFKNAVYGNEHTPGLEGLPLQPGYPEYLICQHADSALKNYLPGVYHFVESRPHKNYQYFFEDLTEKFRRIESDDDFLKAAAALPGIQTALVENKSIPFKSETLCFDEKFLESLERYCHNNLKAYYAEQNCKYTKKVLKILSQVFNTLNSDVSRKQSDLVPIHGDYNPANILIKKNGSKELKALDWEWMGLGLKHADLASLLKPASSRLEKEALKHFAQNDNSLSILEHTNRYNLAKIERGLFDAAFFAKHYISAESESNINIPNHIIGALSRVLRGIKKI